MSNLYFDIAATTPLDNNVAKLITEIQSTAFGNPSSIHQFGQKSRSLIEKARRQISKSFSCKPNEIIFTSGGSESNNLVLKGFLKKGDHFITSSYEHPAIIKVAEALEKSPNLYSITVDQSLKTSCLITGWRKVDCTTKTSAD